MDDGHAAGGPGERHVEGTQALHLFGDDPGRLDHHGGIDLEALDQRHRDDRHRGVEAPTGGTAELDAGRLEGRLHLGDL